MYLFIVVLSEKLNYNLVMDSVLLIMFILVLLYTFLINKLESIIRILIILL